MGFSFYEGGEPRRLLLEYLRQKEVLLILDNCEHLLDGDGDTGGLVKEILQAAARVKVLATSRLRLGLPEEHLVLLAGMDAPGHDTANDAALDAAHRALQSSAVQLFLQGARRVCPNFELSPGDVQPVIHICRLVQGMPLAILLAAAWVELLSLTEIAAEMETSLDFLQTEQSSVSVRQRSVRTVFDYSWSLLTEHERGLGRAVGLPWRFRREAVQEVAGASLRELMSLTNKSLLQRTPAGRYEIHELLRQYTAEKLHATPGEEQTARNRHAAYYAGFLQARASLLHSGSQRTALTEIGVDIDNVRAAWDRGVSRAIWRS